MRNSRRSLGQVRRALLVASVFSVCINLLMLVVPVFVMQLLEAALPAGSLELIAVLTGLAALALAVAAVLDYCRALILLRAGLWVDHTLGAAVLEAGLSRGVSPEALATRGSAVKALGAGLANGAIIPLLDLPWAVAACGLLYWLHPMLALACAAAVTAHLICLITLHATYPAVRGNSGATRNDPTPWHAALSRRADVIAADGLAAGAARRWEHANRAGVAQSYRIGRRHGVARTAARTLRAAGLVGVSAIGGYLHVTDTLAPAAIVVAMLVVTRALGQAERATDRWDHIRAARNGWKTLAALDLSPVAVAEIASGHISLRNATFVNAAQGNAVLANVTLAIAPGEAVGIVGMPGSGKSALAAALAGVLVPVSGRAEIDGIAIRLAQCAGQPRPIGYMADEPRLLAGSVLDNISGFGGQGAETGAARAAFLAGVHEMLAALPGGYETDVGEDGSALPMRVRRAVALARALHGNPRVVVLDEPELRLDEAGLGRLIATLETLRRNGTSLVIATNEPRLLQLTDNIVLLSNGAVEAVLPSRQITGRVASQEKRVA